MNDRDKMKVETRKISKEMRLKEVPYIFMTFRNSMTADIV